MVIYYLIFGIKVHYTSAKLALGSFSSWTISAIYTFKGDPCIKVCWRLLVCVVRRAIVSDYNVNMFNVGPTRYHEWTKPVYQ